MSAQDIGDVFTGLAIAAVFLAAGWSFRDGRRPPGRLTPDIVAAMLVVTATIGLGVESWIQADLRRPFSLAEAAAIVPLAVLFRRERRFWWALALLIPFYTVIGFISIQGLTHNYDSDDGHWLGVRALVAWGGPEANPAAPHFAAAHLALAVLRYGLPYAMTVTIPWLLTMGGRPRWERAALLLLTAAFLKEVLLGGTVSTAAFLLGPFQGLPVATAAIGTLAGLALLFTAGTGPVISYLLSLRTSQALDAAATAASTARELSRPDAPAQRRPARSLPAFMTGSDPWVRRLSLGLIALLLVGVGGSRWLYLQVTDPKLAQPSPPVEFTDEYVRPEIEVAGQVARWLPHPGNEIWLLTRDHRLETFDPATATFTASPTAIADAWAPRDGRGLFAVTDAPTPQVVLVQDLRTLRPLASLSPGSHGTLGAVGDRLYAMDDRGLALVLDRAGTVLARHRVEPTLAIASNGSEVLTAHAAPPGPDGSAAWVQVSRDPVTLAAKRRDLLWDLEDFAGRTEPDRSGRARWTVTKSDVITLNAGARSRTYHFSYDAVLGVVETPAHGTWVVLADQKGVPLTGRDEPAGYLARWVAAPPRPSR